LEIFVAVYVEVLMTFYLIFFQIEIPPLIRDVFETKDPAVWVQKIKIGNEIVQ
jgi:hypothetical protein